MKLRGYLRIVLFYALAVFTAVTAFAQDTEEDFVQNRTESGASLVVEDGSGHDAETAKRGQWNFSVGSSFSYMKSYGSGAMFYVAPTYTYSLNERWSLHGGVVASRYQGLNYTRQGENLLPNSFGSFAIFAAASYQATDRLVLHGAGYKNLGTIPLTPMSPYLMDDLSFGATFKVGNNASIGASIHIRQGGGYYRTPQASPFAPMFW